VHTWGKKRQKKDYVEYLAKSRFPNYEGMTFGFAWNVSIPCLHSFVGAHKIIGATQGVMLAF
jgi:hypothetical protein